MNGKTFIMWVGFVVLFFGALLLIAQGGEWLYNVIADCLD